MKNRSIANLMTKSFNEKYNTITLNCSCDCQRLQIKKYEHKDNELWQGDIWYTISFVNSYSNNDNIFKRIKDAFKYIIKRNNIKSEIIIQDDDIKELIKFVDELREFVKYDFK